MRLGDSSSSRFFHIIMRKLLLIILNFSALLPLFSQTFESDWRECYGSIGIDEANDVCKTTTGYYILATANEKDIWLIKTDLEGNKVWDKKYGGTQADYAVRLIPTNGHFYIIGVTSSSDGDVTYDPYPYSWDYWVLKIDTLGNKIWDKVYGGNDRDEVINACYSNGDELLIVGRSLSSDGNVPINYGYFDNWIIKLDSSGNEIWNKLFGTNGQDVPGAISQTSDNGYILGAVSLTLSQPSGNIPCVDPYKEAEVVLTKLDSLGIVQWNRCYGGSFSESLYDILVLTDGYIAACMASSDDGDLTNSGYHLGYNGSSRAPDTWIVKFDFDGNIIWQKCYGGSSNEVPFRIFQTNRGFRVFNMTSSFDGDVSGNHSWNDTYMDIWTFEIDSVGNLLSNQCFGSFSSERAYNGFVKLNDAEYTFAGYTFSYDWNCQEEYDVFLMKITDTLINKSNKQLLLDKVNVYPNPAKDYIIFQVNDLHSLKLIITNILGIKIEETILNRGSNIINLDKLIPGVFIYTIESNNLVGSGKFLRL